METKNRARGYIFKKTIMIEVFPLSAFRKIKNIATDTIEYASKMTKTLTDTDYKRQGHEFEQFIAGIFKTQQQYFTIVNWTHDQDHKHGGVEVELDKEPDFRIRYNPTGQEFYVECKMRSHLIDNKLKWCNEYQLKKYQGFAQKHPVFAVIGLGDNPSNPDRVFCIPLTEARWTELFPKVYLQYERRPPDKKFFWRNGLLS